MLCTARPAGADLYEHARDRPNAKTLLLGEKLSTKPGALIRLLDESEPGLWIVNCQGRGWFVWETDLTPFPQAP